MKNDIYFNVHVSSFFSAPFNNKDRKIILDAYTILNCPIVSWDIDTKKMLDDLVGQELTLIGQGNGLWVIQNIPTQDKPDTESWNGLPQETRSESTIDPVAKLNRFLFL